MWYRTALPFHVVSCKEVVDAFDAGCSYGAATGCDTVALSSARMLRNDKLDAEVKRIESELSAHKKAVSAYGINLQSDGKDNMARRHLINVITTTPLGAEFRECIDVSGKPRDSEETTEELIQAIGRLEPIERDNLISIVTDTPSVNRKAWKILEKKLPKVVCIPCAAHVLNLHFKHVFQKSEKLQGLVNASMTPRPLCSDSATQILFVPSYVPPPPNVQSRPSSPKVERLNYTSLEKHGSPAIIECYRAC